MVPNCKVPRPDPQQIIEVELHDEPALGVDLGEHGLAMLGDHGGLVTVQAHRRLRTSLFQKALKSAIYLVEGLLGVSELPLKLRDSTLEDAPEESGNEGTTHGWGGYRFNSCIHLS